MPKSIRLSILTEAPCRPMLPTAETACSPLRSSPTTPSPGAKTARRLPNSSKRPDASPASSTGKRLLSKWLGTFPTCLSFGSTPTKSRFLCEVLRSRTACGRFSRASAGDSAKPDFCSPRKSVSVRYRTKWISRGLRHWGKSGSSRKRPPQSSIKKPTLWKNRL